MMVRSSLGCGHHAHYPFTSAPMPRRVRICGTACQFHQSRRRTASDAKRDQPADRATGRLSRPLAVRARASLVTSDDRWRGLCEARAVVARHLLRSHARRHEALRRSGIDDRMFIRGRGVVAHAATGRVSRRSSERQDQNDRARRARVAVARRVRCGPVLHSPARRTALHRAPDLRRRGVSGLFARLSCGPRAATRRPRARKRC